MVSQRGFLVLLMACHALMGCSTGRIRVGARGYPIKSGDGHQVWSYRIGSTDGLKKGLRSARAIAFYVPGSSNRSVTHAIGSLAGFTLMKIPIILVDRRGVNPNDQVDTKVALAFADKETRVADTRRVLDHYLVQVPETTPVLLIGVSEGGDVATAVARQDPRVTHLILIGTGGGMSQADELRLLVKREPGYLGIPDIMALEAKFKEIRQRPRSTELWLGHPFLRWSSFLWSPPGDDLRQLSIPIFLAHGAADKNVPVESARLVRELFSKEGKWNLRYKEYAGLDHSLRDIATGKHALPRLEVDVIRWMRGNDLLSAKEALAHSERVQRAHPEWF